MPRFSRYNPAFQRPALEQYVVSIVSTNGNIVGYAPPFNKECGFAIVPSLEESQKYPRSANAYSRCKGMHVARSMIVSRISAELADLDSQLAGKTSKKIRNEIQNDRNSVQADFDEICGYQFQITKI